MKEKRGLLVDAFIHCGIYPVKNPTCEKDFLLTQSFHRNENSPHEISLSSDVAVSLRVVAPSPTKVPNPCHERPHCTLRTIPMIAEAKRTRQQTQTAISSLKLESHAQVRPSTSYEAPSSAKVRFRSLMIQFKIYSYATIYFLEIKEDTIR
jgi:hypothetical protein